MKVEKKERILVEHLGELFKGSCGHLGSPFAFALAGGNEGAVRYKIAPPKELRHHGKGRSEDGSFGTISFGNTELFLRFARAPLDSQLMFLQAVYDLAEEHDVTDIEIPVLWTSGGKLRTIKIWCYWEMKIDFA